MSKARRQHGGKRPGAGRKPTYERPVTVAARISKKLRDKLDRFAQENGLTRSAALVEAVKRLTKS